MGLDPRGLSVAEFQFTHPGRGATIKDLNRRHPRTVSIHAPREGCDAAPLSCQKRNCSFNSRTPGGVRLLFVTERLIRWQVSIHAPREGCDYL